MATQYLYQGEPVTEEVYLYLVEQDEEDLKAERRFWRSTSSLEDLQEKHVPVELLINLAPSFEPVELPNKCMAFKNEKLEKAIYRLNHKERMIVILHVIRGYKLTEIAGVYGMKYDSIKRCYLRAIKKLKKYIL